MKKIFFLLLFCLIFESILSSNKFTKLFQKIKEKKATKEPKLRKLQDTDVSNESGESNSTSNDTSVEPESVPYTGDTSENGAETGSALAFDVDIPANKPVSTKGYKTGNKNAPIQFSKFQNFQVDKDSNKILFYILFFFKRVIPYRVIFRLRVVYSSRLRNLEETAQSVRTDCTIANEDLVGASEANANFECSANKTTEEKEISSVTINTDIPMTLANKDGSIIEEISFDDVNFNGNSAEEVKNIAQANDPVITEIVTLEKATHEIKGYILTLSGTFNSQDMRRRRLELDNGQTINMHMLTNENVTKTYPCTVNTESESDQLICDTSSSPIDTTPSKLHSSNGQTGSILVNIEMQNPNDDKTSIKAESSEVRYTKSSSGLSGGAIAGIVIACVVVLVAAAIAAIMLRKPTPPIDNSTTAVELRNENL